MEDIDILINLNKLYKSLNEKNEKRIIKRLINKRQLPFLIDSKIQFTEKDLSYYRGFVNKKYNKIIKDFFPNNYYKNIFWYYDKSHWLNFDNEYKKLVLMRANLFTRKENKLFKSQLELLNIYTEEQLELLIKKHFKL